MLELNKIYNENCLITMSERIPDNFVDLTVTSPPYDKLRNYKGFKFSFKHIARHLYKITKQGGVVVWVVGDSTINGSESGTSFRQALFFMECGFNLHDTMIYYSEGLTLNHNRYEQEFEYQFIFCKGKLRVFNPIKILCNGYYNQSDRNGQKFKIHAEKNKKARSGKERQQIKQFKIKGNVWKYTTGHSHSTTDEIAFEHPAIFPEKLAADHIHTWTNEGDTVYDPMGGSGTVAKMAHIANRNWIISEISAEYCNIASKRIAPYLAQTSLFK